MFKILRHYGIPEQITNAIRLLYEWTRSAVRIDGISTDEFKVAPYHFIVAIDWVMTNANIDDLVFNTHKRQSSRISEKRVSELEYTDNIGLLENDKDKAQKQLDALSCVAKEVSLVINADKTKVLPKNVEPKPQIKLDETVLESVDDFQYLGAGVNDTMKNFKHRRAKTWTAFWKLKKSGTPMLISNWKSGSSMHQFCVLLYATETYVINAALKNKIHAFQTQCLRIILNISRDDHVRNEYIYKQTNTKPLMQRVTKTQLAFLGHSIRRNKDNLIQQYCLYAPAHGRRRRGRQKATYQQHTAKMIYGNASVEEKVMRDAAGDRVAWRKVVKDASCFSDNEWDEADQERECAVYLSCVNLLLVKRIVKEYWLHSECETHLKLSDCDGNQKTECIRKKGSCHTYTITNQHDFFTSLLLTH